MPTPLAPELERRLLAHAGQDAEAFRALYRHYLPRIFAYVACRVGRAADAEDITAEVFMQMTRALPGFSYRGEGSFAAWLFRIAHNRLSDHYRARPLHQPLSLDDLPDIPSAALQPEQTLVRKERFARLYAHIAALPPRRAEVVRLRYFGGLRNREIAQVLGLDERTVAAHLSRALDDLGRVYGLETQEEIGHALE